MTKSSCSKGLFSNPQVIWLGNVMGFPSPSQVPP
jgi:hypothetical protein